MGAAKRSRRLFIKNTGLCKFERRRIGPDTCRQVSGPIRLLSNLQSPVFLINSRLDLFAAPTSRWDPFSRSYGVNLPSALTVIHSSTLGYSPRPPVSVYGTGNIYYNLEDFLGSRLGCSIKLPVGSLYCQVSARTNS